MALTNSRYIDPDTGGWVKTDYQDFQRVESTLGYVYGALMTHRGSIAELPTFGSRLHEITHLTPGVTKEIEAAIDEALRPMVGQRFDSYQRKAWIQNGAPLMLVEITKSGVSSSVEIPLALG